MADTDVIDHLIQRYIEATRSLWNTYFRNEDVSDDTVRRFEEIRHLLFASIVLAPLDRKDDREKEDDPIRCFQVQAGSGPLTVLVEQSSDDGDHYWEAAPKDADFSTADLQFVDLFDWDPRAFRDMAYVKVWIAQGSSNADFDQRYALFERQSVSVLHRPNEPV
jgi:hypothetical protein